MGLLDITWVWETLHGSGGHYMGLRDITWVWWTLHGSGGHYKGLIDSLRCLICLVLEVLLNKPVQCVIFNDLNRQPRTPLSVSLPFLCIYGNHGDIFQADFTPLMFASYWGHNEVAEALIKAKCELNSQGSVSSPLNFPLNE